MTNTVATEQRTSPRNAEHRRSVNGKAMTVPSLRLPHLRLGALIAVGLAAFLIAWVAMNRGDDAPPSAAGSGASAASESELRAFADSVSHPVYWAGPKEGYTYELTQTTKGLVYVRYLPEGTDVGDPRSQFLTVGTYPRAGAFAELQRAAKAKGAVSLKVGDDGPPPAGGSGPFFFCWLFFPPLWGFSPWGAGPPSSAVAGPPPPRRSSFR